MKRLVQAHCGLDSESIGGNTTMTNDIIVWSDDKVTALDKCVCLGRHHSAGMTMVFVNVAKKPNNSDYK